MVHSLHYKNHTEPPAQPAWGNKYVKQLSVKQQWGLLHSSYSLYLRHRCTIGNHHKGHITQCSQVLFPPPQDNIAPEKSLADKYKHTHTPATIRRAEFTTARKWANYKPIWWADTGEDRGIFRRTRKWRSKRKMRWWAGGGWNNWRI